ncbi:hypothetical protein JI435_412410 [Parastagonospora nodorum SN15]|uniref:Uncharacterized protein n=1 Tax=Phaeosphaeria nodorum (strain SN15 / ATCC MYA-4574 / FGSC 10173) TaxID=321614 RepID=A0A7U2I1T2_PHANO|nr:hypothetical protein JI435_412410 [Parastagonospora nodorum SN15]
MEKRKDESQWTPTPAPSHPSRSAPSAVRLGIDVRMHVRSCRSPIACPAGRGGGVEISSLISCKCRSTTNPIPEAGNPKPAGLQRTRSARLGLYTFLQP